MITLVVTINLAILIYFTLLTVGYSILLIASFPDIWSKFREIQYGNLANLMGEQPLTPISIIMPAFNEQNRIYNAMMAVLQSNYKNIELIVVNDGSTDDTLLRLIREFSLYELPNIVRQTLKTARVKHYYRSHKYPNLVVLDKEHSETGDTLNAGVNACRTPLFITIDADTIIEPQSLSRMLFTFLSNEHCVAIGGAVYVLNGCKVENGKFLETKIPRGIVPALQSCEYLRSFLFGRSGWNAFGGALSFAGAYTLLETHAVLDAGGYDLSNYAQDAEIIIKLHEMMREKKYPYKIHFTPNSFAWTEVPATLKSFWVQRDHWQRGLLKSFLSHKKLFLNAKFGVVGLFSYPFYIFFEIFGAIVEFSAYVALIAGWFLGIVNLPIVILFIILAWGYIAFLTMASVFINLITFNKYNKFFDTLHILFLSIIEIIGFRQYNVLCRTIATVRYFINKLLGKNI